MNWLTFLHFYFTALCAATAACLFYIVWLVWHRP